MDNRLSALLRACPDLQFIENEALSRHCSFRIGGPCAALVSPASVQELCCVLQTLRGMGEEPLLLGNGTNLLISDQGLDRIVVRTELLSTITRCGETGLYAQAGVPLSRLALFAAENCLTGLEFAHGIPGTLGGAAVMNAGAYGGEMKDVIVETDCVDENGALLTFRGEAQAFSYRHSIFSDKNLIVLGCRLELQPGDESAIRARMAELAEKRRTSQPLDKPSAGSTFKRPEKGYAAALIDEAGLKGYRIGDAAVSEKHAGFVVNLGNATFADVLAVMDHAQKTVYARSGIQLEPEVRIIQQDAGGK